MPNKASALTSSVKSEQKSEAPPQTGLLIHAVLTPLYKWGLPTDTMSDVYFCRPCHLTFHHHLRLSFYAAAIMARQTTILQCFGYHIDTEGGGLKVSAILPMSHFLVERKH